MRFGAAWLNRRLDRFFVGKTGHWLLAPGRGQWPTMTLDLTNSHQRKFFYFPKVYGRFYGYTAFRAFIARKLTPGATFIDIGSNVGFFTQLVASIVGPTGRVYAFEPDPETHECLVRTAAANGQSQIEAFRVALSDLESERAFYRAHDGTASSLVPEAPGREARYASTVTAQVTTLDRLVAQARLRLDNVALVKVDVEGEEARTIAGMLETLRAANFPTIWCEVRGPEGSTRAPNTFEAVRARLAPLGYAPHLFDGGALRPVVDGEIRQRADVVFERTGADERPA